MLEPALRTLSKALDTIEEDGPAVRGLGDGILALETRTPQVVPTGCSTCEECGDLQQEELGRGVVVEVSGESSRCNT